jgi:hypothetical protein
LLDAGFLLGLLFNSEDGGDRFISTDYMALYPRRQDFSSGEVCMDLGGWGGGGHFTHDRMVRAVSGIEIKKKSTAIQKQGSVT